MKTTYNILFTIELLHNYYLNTLSRDFDIAAAPETFFALNNHKILTRNMENKLVALMETEAGKPHITPGKQTLFRFYLIPKKNSFGNYTNISLTKTSGQVYYFSNMSGNPVAAKQYLSQQITPYNSANTYVPGDMSANGSNVVFEALQNNQPGNVHGLGDTAFWKNTGSKQYVSSTDLIKKIPSVYNFSLAVPAASATVKVFGLNHNTGAYDQELLSVINNYGSPQSSTQINFSAMQPGKYQVTVNGVNEMVYYDPELFRSNIFGVIEIYHNDQVPAAFSLLNAAGEVREVLYTLHFQNRSTIWKYITKTTGVTGVNDTAGAFSFSSTTAQQFTSTRPIPLTETPYKTIAIQSSLVGTVTAVKNPSVNQIKQHIQSGSTYYCSEIFINY